MTVSTNRLFRLIGALAFWRSSGPPKTAEELAETTAETQVRFILQSVRWAQRRGLRAVELNFRRFQTFADVHPRTLDKLRALGISLRPEVDFDHNLMDHDRLKAVW